MGALQPNAHKIVRYARLAADEGADLVLFPEMCLCGYPPEDLILKPHFIRRCAEEIRWLAENLPPGPVAILGAPHSEGGHTFNAAFVIRNGRVAACYHKNLLPNYGVFDEKRVFAAGSRLLALDTPAGRFGVHICEDTWFTDARPTSDLRALGIDALLNISASPYHRRKVRLREHILSRAAPVLGAPVLYCNLVGGQDELVFDGSSMVLDAGGAVLARARSFEEDLLFCDLPVAGRRQPPATGHPGIDLAALDAPEPRPAAAAPSAPPRLEPVLEEHAEVYAALKTGLRDYMDKNGFLKAVVALSGGIDSALVAAIAVDALGADRVAGVTMPSQFSSSETRGDAHLLAKTLGIEFHEIPIKGIFDACLSELAPHWPGRVPDITEENLQARIRGLLVMALSNKFGWLVISTGNKSELATGYCTIYGDMVGGFALIKDVPKTLVFELSRWRNAQSPQPVIPPSTIDRPPTAELRPNQKDTDSLPPYDLLDAILERYVEQDRGFDRIVADGFEPAIVQRVLRLVDTAEYKRRQGAPGVKITPKAFGRDRRMPITNLYREKNETESAR